MDQIQYYKAKLEFEIDSWDLYEAIQRSDNVKVIDARSKDAYVKEHIPGAISFPHRDMNKETVASPQQCHRVC